jgi:transcriptional repressor NrdR
LICPYCGQDNDKVIDSRASDGGMLIRRRRECIACGKRFTTYERIERTARLVVVKKDGSRVPFAVENVARGLRAACGKRAIPEDDKDRIVREVEDELHREFEREVSSQVIGQRVAAKLREVDEVAYFRFAIEHHDLATLEDLARELTELRARPRPLRNQQNLFR